VTAEPVGHDLLAGKVALVTAAAGTGIGSATAHRMLLEGATVVISDIHERRLGQTAAELTELFASARPCA
jgi:3-oxoacyl-[acyl-carrier protein] reductase